MRLLTEALSFSMNSAFLRRNETKISVVSAAPACSNKSEKPGKTGLLAIKALLIFYIAMMRVM